MNNDITSAQTLIKIIDQSRRDALKKVNEDITAYFHLQLPPSLKAFILRAGISTPPDLKTFGK